MRRVQHVKGWVAFEVLGRGIAGSGVEDGDCFVGKEKQGGEDGG
jgi:hypothetical protein